jgi:hypothetical protein
MFVTQEIKKLGVRAQLFAVLAICLKGWWGELAVTYLENVQESERSGSEQRAQLRNERLA